MSEEPTRKLAVLLHADVVSSTALVQTNETLAHKRIQDAFRQLSEAITGHGGVPHEIRGDALVAEFSKASDALNAAIGFQTVNSARNQDLPDDIHPVLRIGIAMGEVVVADNTVTGVGVVLAQRLEQLAEPGGVCLQGAAYETVPKRLPFDYVKLGELSLKGFDEPVRAYGVRLKAEQAVPEPTSGKAEIKEILKLPDMPSIAVLPFDNMSGDPEQQYFSDGVTDDIITQLSRYQDLVVIARNSSFSFRGKAMNIRTIAEKLGVRYVLEGGVRTAGKRIRINAQLIDAPSEHHLWAEQYNREIEDVFALQDDISQKVASTVVGRLRVSAQEQVRHKAAENLQAYDYLLQGRSIVGDTEENNRRAKDAYLKAVELDPICARAYMGLSQHYIIDGFSSWGESPERSRELALECALKAASLDKFDSEVQWRVAFVYTHRGEFQEAKAYINRALEINPNDADALTVMGVYLTGIGEAEKAVAVCEKAMVLNPFCPAYYQGNLAAACYTARRYEDVLEPGTEFVTRTKFPYGRRLLAAAYARLGRMEEARRELGAVLEAEPDFSLTAHREATAHRWALESDLNHFIEGLRLAGFPE